MIVCLCGTIISAPTVKSIFSEKLRIKVRGCEELCVTYLEAVVAKLNLSLEAPLRRGSQTILRRMLYHLWL